MAENVFADFIEKIERELENDNPGMMTAVDEIITGAVDTVHLERMDNGCYWLGICKGNQRQVVVFSTRGKLYARTERDA